jgi:hypothetical protein
MLSPHEMSIVFNELCVKRCWFHEKSRQMLWTQLRTVRIKHQEMRVQFNWASKIFLKRIYGFKHLISWNNFRRSDTSVFVKNFNHKQRISLCRFSIRINWFFSSMYSHFRASNSIYIREAVNFLADEVILRIPSNKKIWLKLLRFTLIAYEYFRLPLSLSICLLFDSFLHNFFWYLWWFPVLLDVPSVSVFFIWSRLEQ